MTDWDLPRKLLLAVEDDEADSERRAWVMALPDIVAALARRWSLEVGSPFQPGGSASWVAPASTAAGARVVLKVGWRHDDARHEADGLRAWSGGGAVRLLDARTFDQTSALLLEACTPGTPLSDRPEPEQDAVVADLLCRLWITPPAGHPFRALHSMCDRWADDFDARQAAASGDGIELNPDVVRAGIDLFRDLPRTAERHVLLCTDLHAGNVLAAEREPWLAIDPKPYVGDPTYDALQHMLNCTERLASDPAGFVQRMADLLGLDAQRLCAWVFARCVVESLDVPELRLVAAALAP